jgi:hypothetical protein
VRVCSGFFFSPLFSFLDIHSLREGKERKKKEENNQGSKQITRIRDGNT